MKNLIYIITFSLFTLTTSTTFAECSCTGEVKPGEITIKEDNGNGYVEIKYNYIYEDCGGIKIIREISAEWLGSSKPVSFLGGWYKFVAQHIQANDPSVTHIMFPSTCYIIEFIPAIGEPFRNQFRIDFCNNTCCTVPIQDFFNGTFANGLDKNPECSGCSGLCNQ